MPWPGLWSSSKKDDVSDNKTIGEKAGQAIDSALSVANLSPERGDGGSKKTLRVELESFTQPQTIVATLILTTISIGLFRFYKTYLRRIPQATNINPGWFWRRSIFGKVTSVGDGDNFRIYHTPGGFLTGWGWLPRRRVPVDRKDLKNQTIHVRLAGIDAPEMAHFGRPAQPYSQEAFEWLTSYVQGRRVRAYVYKADQYSRVVATVYVRKGIFRRDVGLQMLRAGLATVYEAKSGAVFGAGLEKKYRSAEWWAKTKRKGMWAGKKEDFESPREYKTRHSMGSPSDATSDATKSKSS